jgi:hypothetical protein
VPRQVELGPTSLIVHLTGLLHVGALKGRFEIPYASIESVSSEPFSPPPGTLRLVGTSIPFTDVREGRFLHGSEWYFLSYEHRDQTVTLRLRDPMIGGVRTRLAVVGAEDPKRLAAEIARRLSPPEPPLS